MLYPNKSTPQKLLAAPMSRSCCLAASLLLALAVVASTAAPGLPYEARQQDTRAMPSDAASAGSRRAQRCTSHDADGSRSHVTPIAAGPRPRRRAPPPARTSIAAGPVYVPACPRRLRHRPRLDHTFRTSTSPLSTPKSLASQSSSSNGVRRPRRHRTTFLRRYTFQTLASSIEVQLLNV